MDTAICAPAVIGTLTRSALRRPRTALSKDTTASAADRIMDGKLFAELLCGGGAALRANADRINTLNVFPVPDGDTGDNMTMTFEGGLSALKEAEGETVGDLAAAFAHGALLGARGNSGVILSQFFGGIAEGLKGRNDASAAVLGEAMEKGVRRAYAAVLRPAEGTILSVARESVAEANRGMKKSTSLSAFFTVLHDAMQKALARAPEALPVLKEAGVVDSGGAGLVAIFEGFLRVLRGEKTEDTVAVKTADAKKATVPAVTSLGADFEMQYGYCTELLLQLQNSKGNPAAFSLPDLQAYLGTLGDSIVTFIEGTVVKLHVHTKEPEKVLAYCRQFGEFLTVKIENMSVQHTGTQTAKTEKAASSAPAKIKKPIAVVAVVNGSGVEQLFRDLGADVFVQGGQSDNSSTGDFLQAYAKIEADDIFVLPDNSNIQLAAQQSAELYHDARIHVLHTRDVGAGYAALSVLAGGETDPAALESAAEEAIAATKTGMLSQAVRDVTLDGVTIHKGDYIGFSGKKMLLSLPDRHVAALALAAALLESEDRFMLTVLCGADTTPAEDDRLRNDLLAAYPEKEIYFARGEQAVYPYIMLAE